MILHIDMDCFFVSAERTKNQTLKGKPVVVANRNDKAIFGGRLDLKVSTLKGAFSGCTNYNKFGSSSDWRDHFVDGGKVRGLAVAVSYEARSYGIKTGATLSEALQLCPDLIIMPSNMPLYYELSERLAKLLSTEIPMLEQYSIDEFFGDLSGWVKPQDTQKYITSIQKRVIKELDLPATIGVSTTKLLAKLAAKRAKPFGTKVVMPDEIRSFSDQIPIQAIAGIGKQSAKYLAAHGVKSIKDMREARGLMQALGKNGLDILSEIEGVSVKKVETQSPRKSIGISRTFDPVSDRAELKRRVFILARHLTFSLHSNGLDPAEAMLYVKYQSGGKNQLRLTFETGFSELKLIDLIERNFQLLDNVPSDAVKHLGISAGKFTGNEYVLDLFNERKLRKIDEATQQIRKKYGMDLIFVASEQRLG